MKSTNRPTIESFEKCLETALNHYADAKWLGNNSPLARPYFLGMPSVAVTQPIERGRAMQRTIADAWDKMWDAPLPNDEATLLEQFRQSVAAQGKDTKYLAMVLELRYLHRVIPPAKRALICEDYLHVSIPQYHRDAKTAIRMLGEMLLRLVHPHLRLEHPTPPDTLYGRQSSIDQLYATLQSSHSVNLCGMSGVGKTSLAAAICQRWASQKFFWYTIRPQVSDRLDNLLFALAFFLHQHGASDLWQQILADGGQVKNTEMASALARHALRQITPTPLLVIDDADIVRSAISERQDQEYTRLSVFLQSLREHATVLFVGQRAIVPDVQQIELQGITLSDLQEWLRALGVDGQPSEIASLIDYTAGNPRMLTLCLALVKDRTPLKEITTLLKRSPGASALITRLVNQTNDEERQVLIQLAVFRTSAPSDAWQDQQSALKNLGDRGLIQFDLSGGVSLLPAWQDLILNDLLPEAQSALHTWAARVRSERGEYTEAAYHYWQAGYPEQAIQIWYPRREYAIASGQATNASIIFNSIAAHRLPNAEQRALALIRAQLARLAGNSEQGLRALKEADWTDTGISSSEARRLRGNLLMTLGDNLGALREYQAGLDDLAELTHKQITLLTSRSSRFKDEGDYTQAWKELGRARYLIEESEGNLWDKQGQFVQAKECYLRALELAKKLDNISYLARTYNNLGILFAFREPEEAFPYLQSALQAYEKMGDLVGAQRTKTNMVVAMMQAGRYEEALPLAQSVVDFMLSVRQPARIASATVNLSEIFFHLGNLDEALHWANVSMAQEQTIKIPYALHMLGLVENARQDWTNAERHFNEIIQTESAEPYIVACAWRGLGQTFQLHDKTAQAQEAFQKAIAMFEQQNETIEVKKTRTLM
jgi:tetratricopeptide (TPR) repeat protein